MKNKRKYLLILLIIGILIIRFCYMYYLFNIKYKNISAIKMNAMIIENQEISEDKISYLIEYDNNKFLLNIYKDKYNLNQSESLYDKFGKLKYGDFIEFTGNISETKKLNNPFEFDYKRYLNSNNIVASISTYSVKKIGNNFGNILYRFSYYLKDYISKKIDIVLPQDEANLFKSIMYGDDRNLDENIKDIFEKNGILHIISVSGSHMMLLITFISILKKCLNKYLFLVFNLFFILIFCIISSMQLSVLRAGIMAIILVVFNCFEFKINIYKRILLSFFLLILYNPYCIFNTGMLMSYAAVLSIVVFYSQIYSYFNVKFFKAMKISYLKKKTPKHYIYLMFDNINKLFSLNLAVQVLLLPFEIQLFNKFELSSFISNLIVVPIVTFQNIIGFLTLFFIHIPFISDILINSNYIILKVIISISDLISKLNISTIYIPDLSFLLILLYYFIILINNFKKYILVRLNKKIKNVFNKIIFITTFIIFLLMYLNYMYVVYIEDYIYFFNVEQGNMALIREQGKTVIIDMGSTKEKVASNILNNFLQAKAIKNIDLIVLTHMHTDHINGIFDLDKEVGIKNIAYSFQKDNLALEYVKLKEYIEQNNIGTLILDQYDNIKFGGINIDILSPSINKNILSSDLANSNSVVSLVTIKNKNYLFMGDATKETEKYVLDSFNFIKSEETKNMILQRLQDIYVLQVGHHGSKTSTSKYFLENIKVKNGIISSKKSVYGHPSNETLENLDEYNINILITENSGAVKF